MTALISAEDALVYVMLTASAVDRTMKDREVDIIAEIIRSLPIFDGYDQQRIRAASAACSELLLADEGLDAIIGMTREALPVTLRETAYALAVEVAASDRRVRQEELVFLEMLADRFDLNKLTVAAIEHSALIDWPRSCGSPQLSVRVGCGMSSVKAGISISKKVPFSSIIR